jgi:signal transduction histidine kinase
MAPRRCTAPDGGHTLFALLACWLNKLKRVVRLPADAGTPGAGRCLVVVLVALLSVPALAANEDAKVLVIYSNGRLLPANVEVDHGLRAVLEGGSLRRRAVIFDEFIDYPRFGGAAYERQFATYLQGKYGDDPPDVVLAVGDEALRFVVAHRADLFAQAPVVHLGVTTLWLRTAPQLPAGIVGIPWELDFAGTIQEALRLHPKARRLVIVTGASPRDREWEAQLRNDVVPRFSGRVTAEFLAGLPTAALLKRLGELDDDSVVFLAGYFRDGDGRDVLPRDAAEAVASASAAPVYAPFDTFIGTGVVGGHVPSFEDFGRRAGQSARRLIDGASPQSLQLPEVMPARLVVDWRQVRRWGIDTAAIPPDTVVRFREPTFFEANRAAVMIATAVFVLQAGLIGWLLVERRRRRRAESAVERQRQELAHASRLAVAAELTASIAHEINQPLGAILSNADAAELILESGADRTGDLRAILADIRRDDRRASEVIRRLRALMSKQELERQPVELNEAVQEVRAILNAEGRRRRVAIDVQPARSPTTVIGDRIEIQQVLINLVVNAMDAMANVAEGRRRVMVSVDNGAGSAAIAVRDHGHGIAPDRLPRVFESFFSTKREGMGLGLSIARTIVEAHGGRIWAENAADEGAIFHVQFPAAGLAPEPSAGRP